MNLKDAWRLKHNLNKVITYGKSNLNASEIDELKELKADDWKKIVGTYDDWRKEMTVLNNSALTMFFIVAVAAYFYFEKGWVAIIALIGMGYVLKTLVYRAAHREGYVDGYESGMDEGINKVLNLTDEDIKDISDRSIEMEMDEHLIHKWDEKIK